MGSLPTANYHIVFFSITVTNWLSYNAGRFYTCFKCLFDCIVDLYWQKYLSAKRFQYTKIKWKLFELPLNFFTIVISKIENNNFRNGQLWENNILFKLYLYESHFTFSACSRNKIKPKLYLSSTFVIFNIEIKILK